LVESQTLVLNSKWWLSVLSWGALSNVSVPFADAVASPDMVSLVKRPNHEHNSLRGRSAPSRRAEAGAAERLLINW